jgi:hypothetical protein
MTLQSKPVSHDADHELLYAIFASRERLKVSETYGHWVASPQVGPAYTTGERLHADWKLLTPVIRFIAVLLSCGELSEQDVRTLATQSPLPPLEREATGASHTGLCGGRMREVSLHGNGLFVLSGHSDMRRKRRQWRSVHDQPVAPEWIQQELSMLLSLYETAKLQDVSIENGLLNFLGRRDSTYAVLLEILARTQVSENPAVVQSWHQIAEALRCDEFSGAQIQHLLAAQPGDFEFNTNEFNIEMKGDAPVDIFWVNSWTKCPRADLIAELQILMNRFYASTG